MPKNPPMPVTSYSVVVGNVLAQLREKRGLNQGQVAQRVGVAQATWSRIESGSSAFTIEQLAEFAQALGVKPYEVLHLADDAADALEARKIHVEPKRRDWGLDSGWVLVGVAVVALVIAAVLSKQK
jgi:transcriptional regulator with XRE-family HTH domain